MEVEGMGRLRLEDYVVGSLPTLLYIPDFITESEQTQLLHQIYEVPPSKWKSLKNRRLQNWGGVVHEKGLLPQDLPSWLTNFTQRICERTGLFPSPINHVLINEYLPDQGIMPHQDGPAYFPVVAIISLGSPVVINFSPHPRLQESHQEQCTVEESSKLCGETFGKSDKASAESISPCSLLLKPRSLIIFKDVAYSDCLHGIDDSDTHALHKVVNTVDVESLRKRPPTISAVDDDSNDNMREDGLLHRRGTRVSLTCRLVSKVYRNLFKF